MAFRFWKSHPLQTTQRMGHPDVCWSEGWATRHQHMGVFVHGRVPSLPLPTADYSILHFAHQLVRHDAVNVDSDGFIAVGLYRVATGCQIGAFAEPCLTPKRHMLSIWENRMYRLLLNAPMRYICRSSRCCARCAVRCCVDAAICVVTDSGGVNVAVGIAVGT
jgi:hypothetical protein